MHEFCLIPSMRMADNIKRYELRPVGHIKSCFKFKNGTPRQPGICTASQASLTIDKDVYNNPEHSLEGLEEFSHVWIIFIFHKNNNHYDKAKVKPPRLNGAKVGVFSTRSPYRLNPVGLTLAKIERIVGDTLYLSGVDMLDGTPVIDIKPYIHKYDQPCAPESLESSVIHSKAEDGKDCVETVESASLDDASKKETQTSNVEDGQRDKSSDAPGSIKRNTSGESQGAKTIGEKYGGGHQEPHSPVTCDGNKTDELQSTCDISCDRKKNTRLSNGTKTDGTNLDDNYGEGDVKDPDGISSSASKNEMLRTANWIAEPPIPKLKVSFTPTAETQMQKFSALAKDENYKLEFITDPEVAIKTILQADPRSTYRRTKCIDRLYFFIVDCMHVTAWFNDDDNVAEVLRVKPVALVNYLQTAES